MEKPDRETRAKWGAKGGRNCRDKYGLEYYSRIGLKGGRSYARKQREQKQNQQKGG